MLSELQATLQKQRARNPSYTVKNTNCLKMFKKKHHNHIYMNNISIGLLFLFGLLMLVNKALNIYQNSYKCEINTFIFYIFLEHLCAKLRARHYLCI